MEVNMSPRRTQSYFSKIADFEPDAKASFEDEFARVASSQHWVPGSQQYTRQRTMAMKEEIHLHYFSPAEALRPPAQEFAAGHADAGTVSTPRPVGIKQEFTDETLLDGYRQLCREAGLDPGDSIGACKRDLKTKVLVNIVDLIDARRTGRKVKVWTDFKAFQKYTLGNRIDLEVAKEEPGILKSLLQKITGPRSKRAGRPGGVLSGRVKKKVK